MTKKETTVTFGLYDPIPDDDQTDWERLRALTDVDIDKAIAEDPDCAPAYGPDFWKDAVLMPPLTQGTVQVTLRLDPEVLAYFKGKGHGYRKRMQQALQAFMLAEQTRMFSPQSPTS